MRLTGRTAVGPYRIEAPLGAGGMGEVYRARDTRLDRRVALKLIAPHLASMPLVRTQLLSEARALASLTHPRIARIYDVGCVDDTPFIVMEYLEGETLAARLRRAPLTVDEALAVAEQVAEALAVAHAAGIAHGDLKPSNVMLTSGGAKLVDFGLARARPVVPAASLAPLRDVGDTSTADLDSFRDVTAVGTLAYLSPERLRGARADPRGDVFAFGAVLFELLAGRPAFDARSPAALMAQLLDWPAPSIASFRPGVPGPVARLLDRCLMKDADTRFASGASLLSEVQRVRRSSPASPLRALPRRTLALCGLLALTMGAALTFRHQAQRPEPSTSRSLVVNLPVVNARDAVLAPHGMAIAYAASEDGRSRLFAYSLERRASTLLAEAGDLRSPFFSPDGAWIGFVSRDRLMRVPADGRTPAETICRARNIRDAAWRAGGPIVFVSDDGVEAIGSDGTGRETILRNASDGAAAVRWPDLLPGGRTLVYARVGPSGSGAESDVEAVGVPDGQPVRLGRGSHPTYVPATGHLLFVRDGVLHAAPFHAAPAALGPAFALLDASFDAVQDAHYSLTPDGTLLYRAPDAKPQTLVWMNRLGVVTPLDVPPRQYESPRISPDGRRLAVTVREGAAHVWTLDLAAGSWTRITSEGLQNEVPVWALRGRALLFTSLRLGQRRTTYMRQVDGPGMEREVSRSPGHQHVTSVSPDGRTALLTHVDDRSGTDIWLQPVDGSEGRPWLRTAADEFAAGFSPDGRWVAFVSDESGRPEVYVAGVQAANRRWQISHAGGRSPVWGRNGREIFFRDITGALHVAPVSVGARFSAGTSRLLFTPASTGLARGQPNFDVVPDGSRFIFVQRVPTEETRLTIVLDWLADLRRAQAPSRNSTNDANPVR